jgi:hypothetical protein
MSTPVCGAARPRLPLGVAHIADVAQMQIARSGAAKRVGSGIVGVKVGTDGDGNQNARQKVAAGHALFSI